MVARLSLASHTISIERNRGAGRWTLMASGGSVLPEEPLRYSASFGPLSAGRARFEVFNALGTSVWGPAEAVGNVAGNAFLDADAPITPGDYKLVVRGTQDVWGRLGGRTSHNLTRTFRVDPNARPAPGGGMFGDWEWGADGFDPSSWLPSPWTIAAILAAIVALGVITK
jgi:hypothetical protein